MNFISVNENRVSLSIIIINYNLSDEIRNCLISFFDSLNFDSGIEFEFIIVDNNSPDKKLIKLESEFRDENIHFYYLDQNLGFGKGCNFGASKAKGKYLCFLNPDTIIKEDIFSPILNFMEKDPSVGIVGPKQQVREPFFDFSAGFSPNLFFEFFNLFGAGVFVEGFLVRMLTRLTSKDKLRMNWILGAAIFIRADLFKAINGFDKDYFMFSEEVDLCKRVSDKDYKIIYYHSLKIHHIGSVSGKRDYILYTIRTYASKNIYITKHYRSFYKFVMKFFLYTQLFSQIIIWTILFPLNREKSKQKIRAFIYLIKNKLTYEHRD